MTSKARQLADLGGDTANLEDISSAYSSGALSNRSKIINGNFDVWQRGTSGSSGYIADRWTTVSSGSTTAISRQSFTLGQTDVPDEPIYFHRVVVTSVAGAGSNAILVQRVEGVRNLAGQAATLSFWAKADASKNIAAEFVQVYGSGGSPSSATIAIGVTTIALTTAWQKFTVTVNIPSISGKTLGTAGDDFLSMNFWFDAGGDFNGRTNSLGQQSGTFDIAQVQLEAGDTATPFEHRSYGQELALCQRYYQTTFTTKAPQNGTSISNVDNYYAPAWMHSSGSATVGSRVEFAVPMRAVPTITYYNSTSVSSNSGIWGRYEGSVWQDGFSAMGVHGLSSRGFCPAPYGLSGNNTTNYLILGGYAAEAEL